MNIDTLKRYIINKNADIRHLSIKPRNVKIPVTKNLMTVVVGARRVGKTYAVLDLVINKLKFADGKFIYLNFEDLGLKGVSPDILDAAINLSHQMYGTLAEILILDEIHDLEGWQNAVYSLFERKRFSIILTGSSSKLLSREIATQLRGRSVTIHMYPLSFEESLQFTGNHPGHNLDLLPDLRENEVKHLLLKYLTSGGLPDVILDPSVSDKFYRDYVELTIFKDMVERHGIKNIFVIKLLINSALSSFAKEYSINAIYNQLRGEHVRVSRKTLYSYSSLLEDVFFSFLLKKFDFSRRKSELSMPKIYLNDVGPATLAQDLNNNLGKCMENTVYMEFRRKRNDEAGMEIYYYRSPRGEVDFLVVNRGKVQQMAQVTFANSRSEIRDREINALVETSEKFSCDDLIVITWGYSGVEVIENRRITFSPLWKWLLQERPTEHD